MANKVVFVVMLVAALSLLAQRGIAQDSPQFHRGPWPIHNGFNLQPTQGELRALHLQDVTPDEAREIDRLYDQLLSGDEKGSQVASRTRTSTGTRAGSARKIGSRRDFVHDRYSAQNKMCGHDMSACRMC